MNDEAFVYHHALESMRGTTLYPLNELKEIYPDIYSENVKKYERRKHLLELRIPPPLDCLWNDVIHFTAVHPQTLFNNLEAAGFNAAELMWKHWFKVPVSLFDPARTIVCFYRGDPRTDSNARVFSNFDPANIAEYQAVPQATLDYYNEQFSLGKRVLLFHRLPHILFKGTIDTSQIEIIKI